VTKICAQHRDLAAGLAPQTLGKRGEFRLVARHEDKIMAALRKSPGVDRADATGSACNQGGPVLGQIDHAFLLRYWIVVVRPGPTKMS
jgi:hypothetical protein